MPISAISAVGSVGGTTSAAAAAGTTASGGAAFGDALTGAIDNLQSLQGTSDKLAIQAVTGNLDDIHDATIASSRAQVTLELVAGVRNKAVDAFNEIMRMQA
ncbi:flagellar hook-basal body complex protein FliE [Leifsonia sp. LS1]|uniref:flagellar hook-basal body complex protein FliE n=1 Tax=Leifsonia sp. LS1 TaxID=2828483 RepID=UPI001CFCDFB5|nr:flagellar hook-basal body complex protein FliE [Leifsonia sp. LS1]